MVVTRRRPDDTQTFDDVVRGGGRRAVLLGNGFSVACDASFRYDDLLQQARFPRRQRRRILKVFRQTGTSDFEAVVDRLEVTLATVSLYGADDVVVRRLRRDIRAVRDGLAHALEAVHPRRKSDVGDGRFESCCGFLDYFDEVFTLNYDLLLFWALNHRGYPYEFTDGFGPDGQGGLVHEPGRPQSMSWLHGGLHLYEQPTASGDSEVRKRRWAGGVEQPIMDQVTDAVEAGDFPLMVMEGRSDRKMDKIRSSSYLWHAYNRLRVLEGTLVTFGWALSGNDEHIGEAILESDVTHLVVGLHGSPRSAVNARVRGAAEQIAAQRQSLRLSFWDTASVDVWGR